MSASKILEKLSRKGQITTSTQQKNTTNQPNGSFSGQSSRQSSYNSSATPPSDRPVDPVVARLKAARKAEREQKERELRKKKGLPPKKEPSARQKSGPRQIKSAPTQALRVPANRANLSQNRPKMGAMSKSSVSAQQRPAPAEKKAKMSFNELMAKASGIDQSKMSIALKQKTKSPEAPPTSRRRTPDPEKKAVSMDKKANSKPSQGPQTSRRSPLDKSRPISNAKTSLNPPSSVQAKGPLPMRKPSSALAAKLQQKPASKGRHVSQQGESLGEQEDEESDLDSFIASEDEEELQAEPEYDRDEIWSIFNRGKKRSHYAYDDYDSDDMEATGAEILEEESRSKRNALLEDKKEMEKEAKLAAMKRARKMGKRS
ncbi:hypothetical protein OXX80_001067 [Metschnikowia pulcherrima]